MPEEAQTSATSPSWPLIILTSPSFIMVSEVLSSNKQRAGSKRESATVFCCCSLVGVVLFCCFFGVFSSSRLASPYPFCICNVECRKTITSVATYPVEHKQQIWPHEVSNNSKSCASATANTADPPAPFVTTCNNLQPLRATTSSISPRSTHLSKSS